MARDNREVEATLLSKFAFTRSKKAADHRWVELTLPGLPSIKTKFSHTRQDISDSLWRMIASQLRVHSSYLNGMIDCTNSQTAYYQQVRTDPHPPWTHLMRGTATRPERPKHRPRRKK